MHNTIRVLVPVGKAPKMETRVLECADRNRGALAVIGLLDNHKRNTDKVLDRIQLLLSRRFDGVRVVRAKKPEAGKRAPDELIADLAAQCQAVINGIGD